MDPENNKKIQFIATKYYLSKLSEEYKLKWYEKIFLEKDFNFLEDLKTNIKKINLKNNNIDDLIDKQAHLIQKISTSDINPKFKKYLTKYLIDIFWDFVWLCDNMAETEEMIINNIDKFRIIEKEIDIKTKSLTKHWFDNEFGHIFNNFIAKKHKEITVIIFDQNNLKNINESYWHEIWQESIWKFWNILKQELSNLNFKYILSNYFGWDEWFLVLIDANQSKSIKFIKKVFSELKSNTYKIKDFDIKLWACAWISYLNSSIKNIQNERLNQKTLLHITDTLLLQAKVQKNKNKSGLAYKFLNIADIEKEDFEKIYTNIQILPIKLKKETLDKKLLIELFEIRKKQNEKIMKARTLWVKKILRFNIDLINEVIWYKIIDHISKTLHETKEKVKNFLPFIIEKISEWIFFTIEKKYKASNLFITEKEEIIKRVIDSSELKKFIKIHLEEAFSENIFNLEKKMFIKNKVPTK